MTQFGLGEFQQFLRQTITVALASRCDPGDVTQILREEAARVGEEGYLTTDADGEYLYDLPSDDPSIRVRDVLGEVMAGSYGAVRIRFYELELRHPGSDRWGAMWAIHDTESGEFVEWVNAGAFRTAAELEEYLQELRDRQSERG